jgi:predicted ATP-binding protein involved in virulence
MRIDRLSIKNFKGFESREFSFHPNFNLVVGENGSGKTSTLDALAVATGSWFLGLRGYDSRNIREEDVRIITTFEERRFEIRPQFPVEINAFGLVGASWHMRWKRTLEGKGGRTTRTSASVLKKYVENLAGKVMEGGSVLLPAFSYYGAGRLWLEPKDMQSKDTPKKGNNTRPPQEFADEASDDDATFFASRFVGYRYSVDPRCSPRDLLHWMQFQRRIELDEEKESAPFRLVLEAIQSCLPVMGLRYSIRHGTLVADLDGRRLIPFSTLSDGYRNMIAMIGDLAYKCAVLNPHLEASALQETPGIVLIDELDLHLHPRWQRRVIEDLRRTFPKIQFICTTHSPQLIGQAKADEIIVLDAPESSPHPGQSFGMDSNWVLRHIMGSDDRDASVAAKLDELFAHIEEAQFEEAREAVKALRAEIGEHPELVEAEALIGRYSRFEKPEGE